ncbi:MAG: sigma-54 interaction domain-containing protein, partial [Syntrophobacteraceae bacterium]
LQMGRCIELEVYRSRKEKSEFFRECSAQLTLDEMERGLMVLDEHEIIRRANLKAVEYLEMETDNVLNKSFEHLPIPKCPRSSKKGEGEFSLNGRKIRIERKPLMHQQNCIGTLIFLENLSCSDKSPRGGIPHPKSSRGPVGASSAFQRVLAIADNAARCGSNVLLQGDTGTGKEVLARYIHDRSSRAAKPFVAINCGSIPRELLGSELFGYEAGAFTGAGQKGHPSKFEIANGGTILLDEISEMPIDSQVYLLRVIEERTVNRLGSSRSVPVDIRIIATSNKDLQREVEAGRFRADLLFRINVLRIDLPPLKERKDDIPLLLNHFFGIFGDGPESGSIRIDTDALSALTAYEWPGNVRELRNTIERALALARGDRIGIESLPEPIRMACVPSGPVRKNNRDRYDDFLNVYHEYQGNISQISKVLRVSRPTVYAWRKKLGMG